jgi:hypothetical protein
LSPIRFFLSLHLIWLTSFFPFLDDHL